MIFKMFFFSFFLLWAIEIPQITLWSFSFHEWQEILEAAVCNIHISFVFNLLQKCGVLAGGWHRQPWSFSRGCWAVICSSPTDRAKQGASFRSDQDPGLTKGQPRDKPSWQRRWQIQSMSSYVREALLNLGEQKILQHSLPVLKNSKVTEFTCLCFNVRIIYQKILFPIL